MTNPQPQPDAEGRVRDGLAAGFTGAFWTDDYGRKSRGFSADDLRALLASLATLREERDALLADKARYNYLADLAFRSPQARLIVADGEWSVDNGNNRLGTGDTCNAALDAARAPQGRTE
jgi:hypothetical protein